MPTFRELITSMREDYLADTFDGIDTALPADIDINVLWKDNQLLRFLNQAQEEAIYREALIQDNYSGTVNLTTSTASYSLDDLLVQVDNIVLSNGTELIHKTRNAMAYDYPTWRTDAEAQPEAFFIKGRNLTVYPTPDANYTIYVEGKSFYPNLVTGAIDDTPVIPIRYHRHLVWYALHLAFLTQDLDGADSQDTNLKLRAKELSAQYLEKFDKELGPKLSERDIVSLLEQPSDLSYSGDPGLRGTVRHLLISLKEDYLPNMLKGVDFNNREDVKKHKLWNDYQLIRFIEEAQAEACKRDKLITHDEVFSINITQGVKEYDIDPRIRQIHVASLFDVNYVYERELTHYSRFDVTSQFPSWRTDNQVKPKGFFLHGRRLHLIEEPDTSYTMEIECDSHHIDQVGISEFTTLAIPEEDTKHLLWYVLHLCYLTNKLDMSDDGVTKSMQIAEEYMKKFNNYFGARLDERIIIHQLEEPRVGSILPINYYDSNNSEDEWNG